MLQITQEAAKARKKWGERILKIPHTLLSIFKIREKEPLKFPTHYFQSKIYCQSERQCRQNAPCCHKARYNKPIGILVIMVQIIRLVDKTKAVKNIKPSQFTTIKVHNLQQFTNSNSQAGRIYHFCLKFFSIVSLKLVSNAESETEMFSEIRPNDNS